MDLLNIFYYFRPTLKTKSYEKSKETQQGKSKTH